MRLCFTLFVFLFTQLFLNLAHAAPNAGVNADQRKAQATAKTADRRKRKPVKVAKNAKPAASETAAAESSDVKSDKKQVPTATVKHGGKNAPVKTDAGISAKKAPVKPPAQNEEDKPLVKHDATRRDKKPAVKPDVKINDKKTPLKAVVKSEDKKPLAASETKALKTAEAKKTAAVTPPKKGYKKGYGRHRIKGQAKAALVVDNTPIKMSDSHKKRYQTAKTTAMNKILSQMGKPYRWGGMSPNTGFDCSGLIYYAYKDVVRIHMPRTANEMYHLRDAAPVKKDELERGDLVFFHITNRGAADHVGVYLGNGQFIQSPRTGRDIQVSYLKEDYWQDHYVGARRVVTPKTIR